MLTRIVLELESDEIKDITKEVEEAVAQSQCEEGVCLVFSVGSTSGIIVTEYEKGHLKDLKEALEKIAPSDKDYHHHQAWGDDNGKSHVRAVFIKQYALFPIAKGRVIRGTWQNICVANLDTRQRRREVIIAIVQSK